jgi:hypothetical protein
MSSVGPLRHTVWHASLHYGEAMKSARGARFTRGRGRGERQRQRPGGKVKQEVRTFATTTPVLA